MKAEKIATYNDKHATIIEYKYRNHTYYVEYPNDWTYCATPPYIQHRDKQKEIDKQIEIESKPSKPVDWDEVWSYLYD